MSRIFESFRIGRFRGLRNANLEDCGSTNLLVGVNNSGKSSVLEALALYCRPFDETEWLAVLRRREARSGRAPRAKDLLWLFEQSDPPSISLSSVGRHPIKNLEVTGRALSRLEPFQYKVGDDDYETDATEVSGFSISVTATGVIPDPLGRRTLEIWDNDKIDLKGPPQEAYQRKVVTLTPYSHRLERQALEQLSHATLEGWKGEVLDLLRRIDPAIE